jgi:hypothetical protein
MNLSLIIAAGGNGSGDFVVGLLVGCCIGILVGPAFRSWQIYREWTDASREARLADRLLDTLDVEADLEEQDRFTSADEEAFRATWRTRR